MSIKQYIPKLVYEEINSSEDTGQTNGLGNTVHYNPSPHSQNIPILKSLKHFTKKRTKEILELYLIHHFPYFFDQNSLPFGGRGSNGRKQSLEKHCYSTI